MRQTFVLSLPQNLGTGGSTFISCLLASNSGSMRFDYDEPPSRLSEKELQSLFYCSSLALDREIPRIPREIGSMVNLRSLSLAGRSALANLPKEISQLQLKKLDATSHPNVRSRCGIANQAAPFPLEITNITSLEELNFTRYFFASIPEEIGQLTNLEKLELLHNRFADLPSSLKNLVKLKHLDISHSNFMKFLPECVVGMTNLTKLSLCHGSILELPVGIGALIHLQTLSVSHNELDSIPEEIGDLVNLVSLKLGDNSIVDLPPEINNLTRLKFLGIEENNFSHFPDISGLTNLTCLNCSSNPFLYIPDLIGNLSKLKNFLNDNEVLKVTPEFDRLTSLEILYLSGSSSTNYSCLIPEIKSLTRLVEFQVHNCQQNSVLSDIYEFHQLKFLTIKTSRGIRAREISRMTEKEIESESLSYQFHVLPKISNLINLVELTLIGLEIRSISPEISYLTNLKAMRFRSNQIQELPYGIGNLCKSLRVIDFSMNRLSCLPCDFSKLTNVTDLVMDENRFRHFPQEILSMNSIRFLELSMNQIEVMPSEICKLSLLCSLDIAQNLLKTIPPKICLLRDLERIQLTGNPFNFPDYSQISDTQFLKEKLSSIHSLRERAISLILLSCKVIDSWNENYSSENSIAVDEKNLKLYIRRLLFLLFQLEENFVISSMLNDGSNTRKRKTKY